MRAALLRRTMRSICVAILLTCGAVSSAYAQDAYWHGVKNADWNEGISPGGGVSNWYSRPPSPPASGRALPPPTGTAIFADGGLTSVTVTRRTRIATMRFLADAPQYGILISGQGRQLTVTGRGIINHTRASPPRIVIGQRGTLEFIDAAHISGVAHRNAEITVLGGRLRFDNDSNGGNARVYNRSDGSHRGDIGFFSRSSASQMTITSVGKADTSFAGSSTAGNAHLINYSDPVSGERARLFFLGKGPAGDGKVTAGQITNDSGTLFLAPNVELTVLENFTQRAEGLMVVQVLRARAAGIVVRGASNINGALVVSTGTSGERPQVGRHVLVRAQGGRTGTFSDVDFLGFPNDLRGRIAYSGDDVVLFVERK